MLIMLSDSRMEVERAQYFSLGIDSIAIVRAG
jgi:hypothetical protein